MKRFTVKQHEISKKWVVFDERHEATSGSAYNSKEDAEAVAKLFNEKYPEEKTEKVEKTEKTGKKKGAK